MFLTNNVARKIPHYSPVQRPKPRSPIASFSALPTPVLPGTAVAQPPVDIEAARARAKNVATQLSLVNPTPRIKSRFSQLPAESTGVGATSDYKANLGLSTTLAQGSGTDAAAGRSPGREAAVPSEANEMRTSRAEEPSAGRQGSEDSSTQLVTRMIDTSLDNEQGGNSEVNIFDMLRFKRLM